MDGGAEQQQPESFFDTRYIVLVRHLLLRFCGQVDAPGFDAALRRETVELWQQAVMTSPTRSVAEAEEDERGDHSGVYRLFVTSTRQPLYVGQTTCLRKRLLQHRRNKFRDNPGELSYQFVPTAFVAGVEAILLSDNAFRALHPDNDRCEEANFQAFKAQLRTFFYDPSIMTAAVEGLPRLGTWTIVSHLAYRAGCALWSYASAGYGWLNSHKSTLLERALWRQQRSGQLAIAWKPSA